MFKMFNKKTKEILFYSLAVPTLIAIMFAICYAFASVSTWLIQAV